MNEELSPQARMNAQYRRILDGLLANAERDLRLAHTANHRADAATAGARVETLRAALEIYAATHLVAHGERPWLREAGA